MHKKTSILIFIAIAIYFLWFFLSLKVLSKKHDSLEADTAAVKTQVDQLRAEANRYLNYQLQI